VASGRPVEFTFTGIGRLLIRDSVVKMKFFKNFMGIWDGSGKLVEALQGVSLM
jgi:CCDC81 eukaryotic HU domain 2